MTEEEKRKEKEYLKLEAQKARREEWSKIRSLGTGAKIQYFWDYYKIVLVLAVVLITVIYIIVNMVIGFRTHVLLYTSILNVNELDPDTGRLTSDFAEYAGGIKKREKIEFDTSIHLDPNSSGTSQAEVANTMKMTALLQTGILDTCLAPGETMQFLQEQGMFMSLDDLLDEDLKAEYQDSGYLYYAPEPLYDEETGAPIEDFDPELHTAGFTNDASTLLTELEVLDGKLTVGYHYGKKSQASLSNGTTYNGNA